MWLVLESNLGPLETQNTISFKHIQKSTITEHNGQTSDTGGTTHMQIERTCKAVFDMRRENIKRVRGSDH